MLRTFCNGASLSERVGSDSIYSDQCEYSTECEKIFTILIDASVRLMNLGSTSPSWPAASSSAASQSDKTVPTSCAKHSVQVRSAFGLPSGSS